MNTTEKVYHEVKHAVGLPAALYSYMYKRNDTVVIDNMCVSFASGDDQNIQRMRKKTEIDGFLFWAESDEGKKWVKENSASISKALLGLFNL